MGKKHAYLIVAHNDKAQLSKLVSEIDNIRNDIYLLVDAKSSLRNYTCETIFSKVNYIRDHNVYWGDYSQIEALQILVDKSTKNHKYYYYHFISGADFPIRSQSYIHEFFENNPGKIFLTYSSEVDAENLKLRTYKYSFCKKFRPGGLFNKTLFKSIRIIERFSFLLFQKPRMESTEIGYGSNWASFDDSFARIILDEKLWAIEKFKGGFLVDELFLHSLVKKHNVIDKVYHSTPVSDIPCELQGNLRYINWWDGSPYTWRDDDEKIIVQGRKLGHIFIRKVSSYRSKSLTDRLIQENKIN